MLSTRQTPLVVLGCRPKWSADGRLRGALGRRLGAAGARLGTQGGWLVVTGGRTWQGAVEADVMVEDLVRAGVPERSIVRERCSLTTRDNARLSGALLRRLGVGRVTLVTCDWHMPRAAELFEREGLVVDALPAPAPCGKPFPRWYRKGHERVSSWLDGVRGVRA